MIELCLDEEKSNKFGACLKVIGVGGAGSNAVNSMIADADIEAVEFIVANTDAQALNSSPARCKVQLGGKITKGLGAGANPDVGRRAAEEDLDTIMKQVMGTDILFLTAGLGGGTGSGALPVIAMSAKEMGILTVAVVTKPFLFEGRRRMKHAEEAIKMLEGVVDTLIVVPNQRLLEIVDAKISMLDAFALSNNILKQAIKGISDIITKSGHINVDFADVKTIMKGMGMALMGTGTATGEDRARQAALKAINSPLLENVSIQGARGVLINITGNKDLGLYEINEAASLICEMVSQDADIIMGSVIDESIGEYIMVTVIATGVLPEKTAAIKTEKTMTAGAMRDVSAQKVVEPRREVIEPRREVIERSFERKQDERMYNSYESSAAPVAAASHDSYDLNDLDTPAFMRKRANDERNVAYSLHERQRKETAFDQDNEHIENL